MSKKEPKIASPTCKTDFDRVFCDWKVRGRENHVFFKLSDDGDSENEWYLNKHLQNNHKYVFGKSNHVKTERKSFYGSYVFYVTSNGFNLRKRSNRHGAHGYHSFVRAGIGKTYAINDKTKRILSYDKKMKELCYVDKKEDSNILVFVIHEGEIKCSKCSTDRCVGDLFKCLECEENYFLCMKCWLRYGGKEHANHHFQVYHNRYIKHGFGGLICISCLEKWGIVYVCDDKSCKGKYTVGDYKFCDKCKFQKKYHSNWTKKKFRKNHDGHVFTVIQGESEKIIPPRKEAKLSSQDSVRFFDVLGPQGEYGPLSHIFQFIDVFNITKNIVRVCKDFEKPCITSLNREFNEEEFKKVIDFNGSFGKEDGAGEKLFYRLIQRKNFNINREISETRKVFLKRTEYKANYLTCAAKKGYVNSVVYLLENCTLDRNNAFEFAVSRMKNFDVVEPFIKEGKVFISKFSDQLLRKICGDFKGSDRVDLLKVLLSKFKIKKEKVTDLVERATANGNMEILKFLLKDERATVGKAFSYAQNRGEKQAKCIDILIGDSKRRTKPKVSVLLWLTLEKWCEYECSHVVKYLLKCNEEIVSEDLFKSYKLCFEKKVKTPEVKGMMKDLWSDKRFKGKDKKKLKSKK